MRPIPSQVAAEALQRAATPAASVSPSASFIVYVSIGGDDTTGDGTDETPYLTLGKAMSVVKALSGLSQSHMALVLVGPGMYVENLAVPPFVIVSAMDPSGDDVFIGEGSGPAITLDSTAWASSTNGYSGVSSILTNFLVGDFSGPVVIDYTGVTSSGQFLLANVGIAGSLTVIGDSTGGGFVFLSAETFVDTDITATGAQMSITGGTALFGILTIASSAAQQAGVFVANCSVIVDDSAGSIVLDASAGQDVTVNLESSSVGGTLTLHDGNGGVTSYSATAGGIPSIVTLIGGAAPPVALSPLAGLNSKLPDGTNAALGTKLTADGAGGITWT